MVVTCPHCNQEINTETAEFHRGRFWHEECLDVAPPAPGRDGDLLTYLRGDD